MIKGLHTRLVGCGALVSDTAGNVAQERLVRADALDIEAAVGRDGASSARFLRWHRLLVSVRVFGIVSGDTKPLRRKINIPHSREEHQDPGQKQ